MQMISALSIYPYVIMMAITKVSAVKTNRFAAENINTAVSTNQSSINIKHTERINNKYTPHVKNYILTNYTR